MPYQRTLSLFPSSSFINFVKRSEKVTICLIAVLLSALFVGGIGFVPIFLCRYKAQYTQSEIWKQTGETWIVIFGQIYNMRHFINLHPGGQQAVLDFLGNDATRLFPRLPPSYLPEFCLNTNKSDYLATHDEQVCTEMTTVDTFLKKIPCHSSMAGIRSIDEKFKQDKVGDLVVPRSELKENIMQYMVIDTKIYNITQYVNNFFDNRTGLIIADIDHPAAYLHPDLHNLVMVQRNTDATHAYHKMFGTDRQLKQ